VRSLLSGRRHMLAYLILLPLPESTPFPYTTLFRSLRRDEHLSDPAAFLQPDRDILQVRFRAAEPSRRRDRLIETGVDLSGFGIEDRKSTRLNSSHVKKSYAVFCLKKKSTCAIRM